MGLSTRPGYEHNSRSGSRHGRAWASQRRRRRARRTWAVQELEPRMMLSTFTVTDTLDDTNTGSLRWAIGQVNSDTGTGVDTIDFDIPGTGPFTIAPLTPLPTLTHATIINGYSQPGASANTQTTERQRHHRDPDRWSRGPRADGLDIAGGGSTVKGLDITGFNNGIQSTGQRPGPDRGELHRHRHHRHPSRATIKEYWSTTPPATSRSAGRPPRPVTSSRATTGQESSEFLDTPARVRATS